MERSVLMGLAGMAVLGLVASAALAWTTPIDLSDPESGGAKIAPGANGTLHVAWSTDWQVKYRFRNAVGQWGPIENISSFFSHRLSVMEDALGQAHIVYTGDGAGDKSDLYHAIKVNGSWQQANLTNSGSYNEDQPRMGIDSQGIIHLVYTKSTGGNTIMYRSWNGTSWTGETSISSGGDSYYHRPQISVDSNDNLHVINSSSNTLYYTKHNGVSWSSPANIGSAFDFFAYPRIAAINPNQLVCVVFDQASSSGQLRYSYSNDGGANWSALQYLVDGHWHDMDAGPFGYAHLAFTWFNGSDIAYKRWDGTAWTSTEKVGPSTAWQGWADITADTNGVIHVVHDHHVSGGSRVRFISSAAETFPPGPITNFAAIAEHNNVHLSWTNPSDLDFVGTVVRYSTTGYPTSHTDGLFLTNQSGVPGGGNSFDHSSVTNGVTYYYSAFAYDNSSNYATGVNASAVPFVPPDIDRDLDVDMKDYGLLQACLSGTGVAQNDPACQDAKLDLDTDVDTDDVQVLLDCVSGANVAYNPACAG
jgi:hypothetical protein